MVRNEIERTDLSSQTTPETSRLARLGFFPFLFSYILWAHSDPYPHPPKVQLKRRAQLGQHHLQEVESYGQAQHKGGRPTKRESPLPPSTFITSSVS
jgi:hypothetical protein